MSRDRFALSPGERKPVRAKLALLAAAAIVFAPAWGGTGTTQSLSSDGSLTGRILAPTVDEGHGASHAVGRATLQQLDRSKQRSSYKALTGVPLRSDRIPPAALWVPNFALALIAAAAAFVRSASPRAPPALLAS